ncbi:MAG: radical SAM protein [Clostridiales Family XIII bacterium]|jgi:anaerobic ribonucleoside-triphosphate reductase activating protein|nr:radical SAM protein [Clostridiales Family XIII bacterium]
MNIARILYPVRVLGPGGRVGIWLCGCHRKCRGCSNPELWEPKAEYEMDTGSILELLHTVARENKIDGFTISGGEPMEQTEELAALVGGLVQISRDIILYSGFELHELLERNDPPTERILRSIAVLIDGPYIEGRNRGVPLRGSDNQRVHIMNKGYRGIYDAYLGGAQNRIQNFQATDGVVSVGIHKPGFVVELSESLADHEKG